MNKLGTWMMGTLDKYAGRYFLAWATCAGLKYYGKLGDEWFGWVTIAFITGGATVGTVKHWVSQQQEPPKA